MKTITLALLALLGTAQAVLIMLDLNPVEARRYRAQVPAGHYGVRAHGTGSVVFNGLGQSLDERALMGWILRDPRYRAGDPIYLLCCYTGKRGFFGQRCFAQRLANLMRCPVVAPTTQVWVFPDGSHVAAEGFTKPNPARPGQMVTYYPES